MRGWDTHHTPVHDADWALGELARRLGEELPVCLVGHSLGGRAALLAGDRPPVRSVVALAPWVYASDARRALAGRDVLIVHGTRDRIASLDRAAQVARGLNPSARAAFVRVAGATHAMVRHHALFDGLAADFAAATLLRIPAPPDGPLARVRAGERWVEA